jgi:hypothetical protein
MARTSPDMTVWRCHHHFFISSLHRWNKIALRVSCDNSSCQPSRLTK